MNHLKVQINWRFFIDEFENIAKIRKIVVYRFLISFLVPELQRFKEEEYHSKKCPRKLSKSIKISEKLDAFLRLLVHYRGISDPVRNRVKP